MALKANAKLDERALEFVLRSLACGFGLRSTAAMVADEFGVKISHQAVAERRDAHSGRIATLRAQLADDIAAIPFANKLNRVAHLDAAAKRMFERNNYPEFRALTRQIAEEVGDIRDGMQIEVGLGSVKWVEVEMCPDEDTITEAN